MANVSAAIAASVSPFSIAAIAAFVSWSASTAETDSQLADKRTAVIQEAVYACFSGETDAEPAMKDLQTKLTELTAQ